MHIFHIVFMVILTAKICVVFSRAFFRLRTCYETMIMVSTIPWVQTATDTSIESGQLFIKICKTNPYLWSHG